MLKKKEVISFPPEPQIKHNSEGSMAGIFYGWWIILACFLIAFYVSGGLYYGFTAFLDPIVKEFGWSYTQVSIAFSLRGLEIGILAPFTGLLVDRFGSRRLAFSGALIIGFGLIILSLTDSLIMLYSAFVLIALGTSGCGTTVLMTAVAHWFRKNVGKAMGIVACGFGAGGILIPFIVLLIDLYQWRTVLIVLGLGMWALGVPLSLVIRHRPENYGCSPDREIPVGLTSSNGGMDIKREINFREALKNKSFWMIGMAETIQAMITMAVVTHVMPYLSSIGMSRLSAAFVATSIPLISIIGRLGFGWVSDIFDKRYVLAVVYCFFGMGTLAFSYINANWFIYPFVFLFPLGLGGAISVRGAILNDYFGREAFGKLLGIIMGMDAIGEVIGPPVAGWTFDNLGGYQPVWLSFAGTTVIAIVLILKLKAPCR